MGASFESWRLTPNAPSLRTLITNNGFSIPFTKRDQLNFDFDKKITTTISHLPGQPRISMHDKPRLANYLSKEFVPYELETLAPHLWMMTTQWSGNVWPLHSQKVLSREIVISEDPKLHLTWAHERIFIKPLPAFLFSHGFWQEYLVEDEANIGIEHERVRRAIKGFVRTYTHLIKHESDFEVAITARLIPSNITWPDFCAFISGFEDVLDSEVSPRYQFGEIRLTRLNLYAKIFLGKAHYLRIHGQYSAHFARYFGPFLFIFGLLSIVLESMQVAMAVEAVTTRQWIPLWSVCRWLSVVCMTLIMIVACVFLSMLLWRITNEWIYAVRDRRRIRKAEKKRLDMPESSCVSR